MGCSAGPNIVKDNLVFAYEQDNKKSWKGKPTTNLYADGDYLSKTLHPVRNGPWTFPEGVFDPNGNQVIRIDQDGTTSYHGRDIPVTIDTTYTASCWIYVSPDCDSTLVRLTGEQGFAPDASYDLNNKGTWQFVSVSGVATTTNARILVYQQSNMTTGYCLFGSVQFEEGSFPTPFVEGSRSSTNSIIDLTKNNVVTVNGLTYNADGTFEFNGSTDTGFSIPGNIDFTDEQTIEMILYSKEADTSRRNPYNQAYGGFGTITHEPDGRISYYFGTQGGNAGPYTSVSSNIPCTTLTHVVVTRDITSIRHYENGVLKNTTANVYGSLPAFSTANINIGSGYAGKFLGEIPLVRLYNKALTESEVKNNFKALKDRYSL